MCGTEDARTDDETMLVAPPSHQTPGGGGGAVRWQVLTQGDEPHAQEGYFKNSSNQKKMIWYRPSVEFNVSIYFTYRCIYIPLIFY